MHLLLRLAGSPASEEQQLLTALYQCPVSIVRGKLPVLADLLESAQAGDDELTRDGAELSVAVCRAFGIVCPVSCRMLPGIPFLLLLQSVDLCESGEPHHEVEYTLSTDGHRVMLMLCAHEH